MAGIKEIAKKAGVSIGTVDRVLHNRGRFAKATQDKVLEAAKELNYQPNLNARRLKHKEPCRILVMMAHLHQDQGYWKVCLKGIEQAQAELQSIGVEVVLSTYDRYSKDSFFEAARPLEEEKFSGVLLAPLRPEDSKELMEQNKELPFVIFDCPLSEGHAQMSILQDPLVAGQTAGRLVSYMVQKDEPTAVISYESQNPHQDLRAKGFLEVMQKLAYREPDHFKISHELSQSELSYTLKQRGINLCDYRALFISKTSVHTYAALLKEEVKRPTIVGYDLVEENIEALKRSEIDFLISQDSSAQTYQGIKSLANFLLDGQEQNRSAMPMPVDILTAENIDLYLQNH